MAGHVFISHGSENSDEANALCAFIEGRGVKCWIAPRDVRPGIDYSEELQAAIETCAAFVVLVTDVANKSPYVRAETEMAFSCHKPIFPVRQADIKPAAGLALFLKIRHWTDAYGKHRDAAMERLALELQTVVGTAARAPSPAPPPIAGAPPPLAADRPGGGRQPGRWQAALFVLLAAVMVGAVIFLATRPGQAPERNVVAQRPAGITPRGEVNAGPANPAIGVAPLQSFDNPGPNREIDDEALRNALDEARNLIEQGRDPIGEALSAPAR